MRWLSAKGFTLVEMMVVIAVIGILSAMLYPNFQQYMVQRRLTGAARVIMSDLMNARMEAVSKNCKATVELINNHQYRIVRDLNNNGATDTGEALPTKDIHADVHTDFYDVTFVPSVVGYNPVFNSNGTAINGTIRVTNTAGSERKITIGTGGGVSELQTKLITMIKQQKINPMEWLKL